ncbi:MAG: assimilatory sulfite reductase (NADPH) flavoprotein subunit [Hyphomicrobiales bacterium]|nr:MAG: assimilatory sulfite reductase (NADPH) flavoprotein subunit [Hyphomicrobiales bacterium]
MDLGLRGNPLTPEQWQLAEQLSGLLGSDQALWLSGYFTGFGAGLRNTPSQAAPSGDSRRPVTILYGTETGNSAEVARRFQIAADAGGLPCTVVDMADYKVRNLAQERDLLIIVSTYGEGDPPQPASGFFDFIERRKAPKLTELRYAVLSLGDSTYEYFCQAGKRLDQRLEDLGGRRLAPRTDCDVDYEETAEAWTVRLVEQLTSEPNPSKASAHATPSIAPARALASHDKRNPFNATVIENIAIVGRGSSKETRHVELSLAGSGLTYEPGDALGIAASNDPEVVSSVIEALDVSPAVQFEVKGRIHRLSEALTHSFEVTAATPRFLDYWANISNAAPLRQLQQEDRAGERSVFLRTHHIVDIIRRFPVQNVMPQGFVSALRPLQSRLYSIASSLAAAPDEAHLTVAPVRYDLHGLQRSGVASGLLADRAGPDSVLPVYIQSNPHFRLPNDDAPIIMIGAGTGIAPYRAFLQEREARAAVGRSWLFFGERNFRTDFLYQVEWQDWLRDGALSRMDVAFSRDGQEKNYVQHRMKDAARDVFGWLEDGAHVYVCGDAAKLAPDVHQTLIEIVAQESRMSHEAAEDYIRSLQSDRRYQRDVY